ncbi:hypothetical protein RHSIM_Rhsim12G0177600 [Rhododendron simsii]|uniref:DUF4283 domain-containing protein n=1 Tax=Rhododendron simsii TaxID=118357 RepID=A0A834L5M5_RHOSS|nr:hypothetical protein RHSIM_Rhsim12G0177600 [Rhododendron simsii]
MAVRSPVSGSIVDFPPLGSGGRAIPNPTVQSVGVAEGVSMIGASPCGPRVSESDRNVAFELLDADLREIYSHLQFGRADDSVARQIKALTAKILVLRQKAEANLSSLLIEGKSQDPISLPSPMDISSPWKNLLVNKGNTAGVLELQFFPPSEEGGKLLVTAPPAVGELGAKKWQSSLMSYFLDRKAPYMTVKSIACRIWEKFDITDVLSNEDGFYLFLFNNDDAYKRILDSGPWHIGGRLMILKKWEPQMCLVKDQLVRIPIWVQLYNIPHEYWTAPGLSYVASAIGRPLYADSMTEKCRRLSYAGVCVEIEVGAYLPSSFCLRLANGNDVEITAKYPWKPLQCLDCKVFGHNGAGCPKNAQPVVAPWAPPQVPQHVRMPKPSKGKVVAAVAGTTKGPKVHLQQDNGKLGSPSNKFAVLENFDLASNADLVVGLSVVPPPTVPLISGEGSQACEGIKLASPPTKCSHNSEDVISRSVQDIEVAVMQEAQISNQVELIPEGLDVGFEPPGAKKKPKKPNKKR